MTSFTNSEGQQPARLESALKNAVVESWDELMPDSKSGLIHIEYQTRPDGSLDFLFIWASKIRGYWNLVCELWTRPLWSHVAGIRLGNDYHDPAFTSRLELVIAHQNEYATLPCGRGLIQVYPPGDVEWTEATHRKKAGHSHDPSLSVRKPVAA